MCNLDRDTTEGQAEGLWRASLQPHTLPFSSNPRWEPGASPPSHYELYAYHHH